MREPSLGRLRDAQRALAADYGFDSWDALRQHIEGLASSASQAIVTSPRIFNPAEGEETWKTLTAAADGDVADLRDLLARDPRLSRAQYWYTPAIHFAVPQRAHRGTIRLLLDAGADPESNGLHDGSLIAMARNRGHYRHRRAARRGAPASRPRRQPELTPSPSLGDHPR